MQTLLRRPRMTQVPPIMSPVISPVMSPVAGKCILPLRFCAPVATGALGFGGRHKDGKDKGKEDPYKEDGQTLDVAHCIPSFLAAFRQRGCTWSPVAATQTCGH